ncbi:MAG TPA: LPP20 family lipoprotein [Gammaproteobacteria bacterium]
MMSKPLYLLYPLSVMLLTACASNGGKPAWISGADDSFPESQYLTATGSAASPEDAKTRAMGNLAKIFEVRIDDAGRDESEAWMQSDGENILRGNRQATARFIDAYTTKLLEGADIAELWQDGKTGQHHALAVIPRAQASARLGDEIRKYDRNTQTLVTLAGRTADPFKAAQYLYQARTAQANRAMLQRDLQIIDINGVGVRPLWTVADLDTRIDQRLGEMTVTDKVLSDTTGELERHLQSGIAAAGMRLLLSGAAYRLEAQLDIKNAEYLDGWYWYRGALELSLLDNRSNTVLAAHRWPLKTSGQTENQAEVRLKDQLLDILNTELKTNLLASSAEIE